MIFHDVFITPQVFNRENLDNSELREYILTEILHGLDRYGMITGWEPYWHIDVLANIQTLETHGKKKFKRLISKLKKNKTIICHMGDEIRHENEDDWIAAAENLQLIKPFDFQLATKEIRSNSTTLEKIQKNQLLHSLFCNNGIVIKQNKANLAEISHPILAYAQIVRIYDPHFNILDSKDHRPSKYLPTLEIVARLLNSRRDQTLIDDKRIRENHEASTIIIHTLLKYECKKYYTKPDKIDINIYIRETKQKLQKITDRYKHNIMIYFWDDHRDKKKKNWQKRANFHDRYLTTERCCVQVGNGLDITEKDSAWSIIEQRKKGELEKDFREDNNGYDNTLPYELVETVSSCI